MLSSHIKRYKSRLVNSGDTNGERISNNEIQSGVRNNLYPPISAADRAAGVSYPRKHFFKFASPTDEEVAIATFFLGKPTSLTDSKAYFWVGTQRDQQSDITGSERKYATGTLTADIVAGATSLGIDFEPGLVALNIVQAGDKLVITNNSVIDFVTVDTVTPTGDHLDITLTAGCEFDHLAADSYVGSCHVATNVKADYDSFVVTSASGTYDDTTYPVSLSSIGTDEETITITKGTGNVFTVLSDVRGALAAGDTTVDYAPTNPDNLEPLFTLLAAGWGGTWAEGDTITLKIHPCAVAHWINYDVSTGATQTGSDTLPLKVVAEV